MTNTDELRAQIALAIAAANDVSGPSAVLMYGHYSDAALTVIQPAIREAQAEALRDAARVFAEGAWSDQFVTDRVDDDVSAVQSTERWFNARADMIEKSTDDGS